MPLLRQSASLDRNAILERDSMLSMPLMSLTGLPPANARSATSIEPMSHEFRRESMLFMVAIPCERLEYRQRRGDYHVLRDQFRRISAMRPKRRQETSLFFAEMPASMRF